MQITGRITRDAQVHTVKGDKKVVNFTVAVNDGYKDKSGEWVDKTAFFQCAYWRSANISNALTKGRLVEVTGRASATAWLSENGTPKANLNFHTTDIKFHDSPKGRQQTQTPQGSGATEGDDLPF